MCPSIFFPTPLPPGHLRVQSRGGLVQFRGWYPEAITRAIPWVLPGGRMGNQKIEWNITLKISIFANSCKNDIFEKNFFVGILTFYDRFFQKTGSLQGLHDEKNMAFSPPHQVLTQFYTQFRLESWHFLSKLFEIRQFWRVFSRLSGHISLQISQMADIFVELYQYFRSWDNWIAWGSNRVRQT